MGMSTGSSDGERCGDEGGVACRSCALAWLRGLPSPARLRRQLYTSWAHAVHMCCCRCTSASGSAQQGWGRPAVCWGVAFPMQPVGVVVIGAAGALGGHAPHPVGHAGLKCLTRMQPALPNGRKPPPSFQPMDDESTPAHLCVAAPTYPHPATPAPVAPRLPCPLCLPLPVPNPTLPRSIRLALAPAHLCPPPPPPLPHPSASSASGGASPGGMLPRYHMDEQGNMMFEYDADFMDKKYEVGWVLWCLWCSWW